MGRFSGTFRAILPLAIATPLVSGVTSGCLGDPGLGFVRDAGTSLTDPNLPGDAGAPSDASGSPDAGAPVRFHPPGYAAASQHGVALEHQDLDCRGCHGTELEGTPAAPGCDDCHTPADPPAWRKQCTFCHGGLDNTTGAPPRNLDGTRTRAEGRFPPHTIHVESLISRTIDCVECHVKAVDVLSPDHVFDDTKARAEVDFGTSRSRQGAFDAATGTCINVYCHGTGRGDDGRVRLDAAPRTCEGCHPGPASGATGWAEMSGLHALHLSTQGVTCGDCHNATTKTGTSISDASKHIDAVREVSFSVPGFELAPGARTCAGTCHGYAHADRPWQASNARFHPQGWNEARAHGPEMELGRMDCRSCHGVTLEGTQAAPSCDSCHQAGWRTRCTFCHGGGQNTTGAPPRDLGAAMGTASQSFRAHTAHVAARISRPLDCRECHAKPTDVLTAGHAFDGTVGKAEVTMTAGLSSAGTYDGAGGCATLYCHSNGRGDTGAYRDGSAPVTCRSCHPDQASGQAAWRTMSGDHARHLGEGIGCAECHATVTRDGTSILAPELHVDKQRQVSFGAETITYDPATRRCSGSCHGEGHNFIW